MSKATENKIEKFIKNIMPRVGNILMKNFKRIGVKYTKGHALDVVTEADLKADSFIINSIERIFPRHGIISEENKNRNTDSEYVWVIDPLDGTLNFAYGVPIFVTMIAVFKGKKLLMSAIYDPVHKEFYFARRGRGAFLNGKKINPPRIYQLEKSIGCLSSVFMEEQRKLCNMLVRKSGRIMAITVGSAGFNGLSVAKGARDWFINFNPRIWDIAPSILLLTEVGHKVTNIYGKPWNFGDRGLIAAHKKLHPTLAKMAKKSLEEK